ncbi:MAG: tetratricopeptide repeat protein [Rubrivivax sp.]|jgi:predicted negative regulator of RcsB-dependent stress response|nr:tetratricopeptide repeat protein [Rubrivivax sp.]
MATQLDLQEQEQLDQLKAFWRRWGNVVTWILIAVLGAYAAWTGWQWYERDQAVKAGAMFDELDRAVQAGDAERAARVFADLRERYPGTTFAAQGGLAAARAQFDKGQPDAAKASLDWVAEQGAEPELRTVARLRLAGLLLDAKRPDEALQQLARADAPGFEALVADRRGDVLAAQGRTAEAVAAYRSAWDTMPDSVEYRRLVEAKLTALGAAPAASAPAGEGR